MQTAAGSLAMTASDPAGGACPGRALRHATWCYCNGLSMLNIRINTGMIITSSG